MGSNCLVRNDLTHVIAGIAGARNHGWNPAGTPRDTVFLAAFGAMTPVWTQSVRVRPAQLAILADRRWPH